jgi:hypothetical protein
MNRRELAKEMAKAAPRALEILDNAVDLTRSDGEEIIKTTLADIIQAVVFKTCTRIAQEHIFTEPSRN